MFKKLFIGLMLWGEVSFAADWTGATSEPDNVKRIGEKSYYVITTAEELAWFAAKVNDGETEINALLANDIPFKDNGTSSVNWTPIGKDSTVIFSGIFDGAGYTIYGLRSMQSKFAGLFGVTSSSAEIKNVNMEKNSIGVSWKIGYAGGIAAVNNGTIRASTNSGIVSGNVYDYNYAGGIAGWNGGEIHGCTNSGKISLSGAESYTGGIAGWNKGTIDSCTNSGTVSRGSNSYGTYAGPVAGWNEGTISNSTTATDWTGAASKPENVKQVGEKSYYVITTAEELAWFAGKVNMGKTEINALLAQDIRFTNDTSKTSSVNWTPIGRDSTHIFSGTFDGAGYTIYGLYSAQSKFAGLFGVTAQAAVVKDLNMVKDSIRASTGSGHAGGIVAVNGGAVSGCSNAGYVSVSIYSGGISGQNSGTIHNCVNTGEVSDSDYSGGISGQNSGTIHNCENSGKVSDSDHSGGIAGLNLGTISTCANSGAVSASYYSYDYSGGIVTVNSGTVSDCINLDTSSKAKSGLVDSLSAKGTLKNSFSYGEAAYAGIVRKSNGSVTNAYYDSDVLSGKSTVSPNLGKTTAAMQKDQFAWILNTTNGTEENSKIWSRVDAYPVFADAAHLPIYKIVFDDGLGGSSNRYTNYKGLVSLPDDPEPKEGNFFVGWFDSDGNKVTASTSLTGDQTVTAAYTDDSTSIFYTIRFYDADSTLLDSVSVQYGITPKFSGTTPKRAKTAQYTYTFSGWNVTPAAATRDFDYYAVYGISVNSYLIAFMNGDDVLQSGKVIYGEIPEYSGEIPTRASTADSSYTFTGWIPSVVAVTGEAIYSATFSASAISKSSSSESSSSSASSSSSSSAKSSSSSVAKSSSSASTAIISGKISPKFGMNVVGRTVQISGAKANVPVAVFDMQGRMLNRFAAPAESFSVKLPNAGNYVLRIGRDASKISVK